MEEQTDGCRCQTRLKGTKILAGWETQTVRQTDRWIQEKSRAASLPVSPPSRAARSRTRYALWDSPFISAPLVPSAAFVSSSPPCFHLLSLFFLIVFISALVPPPPSGFPPLLLCQRCVPTVSRRRANPCLVELRAPPVGGWVFVCVCTGLFWASGRGKQASCRTASYMICRQSV